MGPIPMSRKLQFVSAEALGSGVRAGIAFLPGTACVGSGTGIVSTIDLKSMSVTTSNNLGDEEENKVPQVNALCRLPMDRLAIGLHDGVITVISQSVYRTKDLVVPGADGVASLALLRTGYLAAGYRDGIIRVWDSKQRTCLATLAAHTGSVSALIELEGVLVSGSQDSTVAVWRWDDASSKVCPPALVSPNHACLPICHLSSFSIPFLSLRR